MMDTPKPLPRTKIRNQPVLILNHENEIQKLNREVPVHRSKVTTITENQDEQDSSRRSNECPAPSSPSNSKNPTESVAEIGSNFSSSLSADKEDVKTENEVIENLESIENDESEEDQDDQSEIYAKADEDDDELVIKEILRFKKTSIARRKLIDDEIESNADAPSSEASASSSSSKTKIVNNDAEAEQINEDLLGVHIHRTDCLKMDRIIRHPTVIVHIVDDKGTYLSKSEPAKNVTYNQETSNFILPVMTSPFSFKEHGCIIPRWEETLMFNENSSHIINSSSIFFFEVVDFIDSCNSDLDYSSIGWHRIAWAFLKPISPNNVRNIGKMLRLQLYYSDAKSTSINKSNVPYVYNWYRKKHWKPYSSTLYVTITTISALKVDSKPQQRSCTPLQPEIGSNSSVKSLALFNNDEDEVDSQSPDTSSATYRLSNIEWSRFPGQSCKMPNIKIATLHPDPRGSLAVKFSNQGIFLACGTNADVFIYAIDGVLERRLINHQGLIYTLSWFTDDSLLLSASADCTACIWDMKSACETPLQILPHPSFIYCSTFIYPEQTIATGCYDGIVRIWWHTHASSRNWQLHQELTGHEEYVSAICSLQDRTLLSGDSRGQIIRWTVDESSRWFKVNIIKSPEIQNTIINKLVVFPGEKRLLIHTRDSLLRTMDIKSTAIIQWYQGGLNDTSQCNCAISPCGSLVLANSEDGTVNVWESNTAKHLAFYSFGSMGSGSGGAVDYHPLDHICAFSSYSTGNHSSSVNLLKYSNDTVGSMEVMLFMLNKSTCPTYESFRHTSDKESLLKMNNLRKGKSKNLDMKSSKLKK